MKKKYFFLFVFSALFSVLSAQTHGFNYKFLITDNNAPLANHPVNVKFTIKNGSTVVWEEEHTGISTDDNGIASCFLGEGNRLSGTASTFDEVDWSQDLTYDVDINTGSGYTNYVSNAPFKYVPKAKYAETADFNNLTNKPVTFYLSGTIDTYPSDINDAIYHLGSVLIGYNAAVIPNTKLLIKNNASGGQTGQSISIEIPSGDNSNKIALTTHIGPSGGGYLTGIENTISADGNGTQITIKNRIDGDGGGTHIGLHNYLGGSTGGFQVGEYTQIANNGDNYQYGNYMEINNSGDGIHVGYATSLYGSGNGMQIGLWNYVSNSGTGDHIGVINEFGGTSDATIYGTKNTLYTDGSGDKYGTYTLIDPSSGGTHYGIYSEVTKTGSYAGYFKGDVYMDNKLLGSVSGNADMKPYIYGSVTFNGNTQTAASSDGFTASQTATGEYRVDFMYPPGTSADYLVTVTLHDNSGFGATYVIRHDNYFVVKIADLNGNAINQNFFFVVYKK